MDYKEDKKIKIALWFITHKEIMKRGVIMLLVLLNIVLVVFVFTHLETYLLGVAKENKMLEQMGRETVNYAEWYKKNQPLPLEISVQTAVTAGKQKYDFVALVKNPNEKWLISSLKYKFQWDSGESDVAKSFILPQEQKYLLFLGAQSNKLPKNVKLEFQNLSWKRVSSRLNLPKIDKKVFKISETEFIPKGTIAVNRAKFKVKNVSAFNFWKVGFNILLYQGKKIVGVNKTALEKFFSEQTRKVEVSWAENVPTVTNIVIDPEINILDPKLLMPLLEKGEMK